MHQFALSFIIWFWYLFYSYIYFLHFIFEHCTSLLIYFNIRLVCRLFCASCFSLWTLTYIWIQIRSLPCWSKLCRTCNYPVAVIILSDATLWGGNFVTDSCILYWQLHKYIKCCAQRFPMSLYSSLSRDIFFNLLLN